LQNPRAVTRLSPWLAKPHHDCDPLTVAVLYTA
jgi:hypothetical protein